MKIELKDGFCVSCGRASGVLYRCCPYCGERVWHPVWRRIIRVYVLFLLPLFLVAAVVSCSSELRLLWDLCKTGTWYWQLAIGISAGLLLMPRHDRTLILTSSRNHALWLLNSLTASALLLLCAIVFSLTLRQTGCSEETDGLLVMVSFAGAVLIPFVLNSGWWRVALAVLLALGLLLA